MSRFLKTPYNMFTQSALIPKPTLTEHNTPDQSGKVFIVTGANTGIGKDLSSILYSKNATVYAAGRDIIKVGKAVDDIKTTHPSSQGKLEILKLDLSDLPSIKASAEDFLGKEKRLDVLWNNAGVMMPPHGSTSPQGHELQMSTNCLGPYLFTSYLKEVLVATASAAVPNSVRVAWAGSLVIDFNSPRGGARFDDEGNVLVEKDPPTNYGVSKAGNLFLAQHFAKEVEGKGVVSVCFNPGNLRTDLQRHVTKNIPSVISNTFNHVFFYPGLYGAYTELYCGLSEDITTADNGVYVAPWGRKSFNRSDIENAGKTEAEGGSGNSEKFVTFVRKETKAYL